MQVLRNKCRDIETSVRVDEIVPLCRDRVMELGNYV